MNKVKISLKEAGDFLQAGFVVECYVLPMQARAINTPSAKPKSTNGSGGTITKANKGKPNKNETIMPGTLLTLSMEGRPPVKGIMGAAWSKTVKELWKQDITKAYTRKQIESVMKRHKCEDTSAIAYITNKLKCLRRSAAV